MSRPSRFCYITNSKGLWWRPEIQKWTQGISGYGIACSERYMRVKRKSGQKKKKFGYSINAIYDEFLKLPKGAGFELEYWIHRPRYGAGKYSVGTTKREDFK